MRPFCLLLAVLGAGPALAQGPAKGMLLVATPELRDPRFVETVVLLLHHESEGTLGVAVNRPTWVEPSAAFPDMEFLRSYRGTIFVGGPVSRANILVLVRDPDIDVSGTEPVFDDVYVSADPEFLDSVVETADNDQRLRLYAGHASWDEGQLEREIAAGHWRVVPATAEWVFSAEPAGLWRALSSLDTPMTVGSPTRERAFTSLP